MADVMNPMMREQLSKDGYIMCYSGMKMRQLPLDQINTPRSPCRERFLSAASETFGEKIVQFIDFADLANGGFDIVFDSAEADGSAIQQNIASAPVAVAGLADGSNVAEGFAAIELEFVIDLIGCKELSGLGEDAGYVRMSLEHVARHLGED